MKHRLGKVHASPTAALLDHGNRSGALAFKNMIESVRAKAAMQQQDSLSSTTSLSSTSSSSSSSCSSSSHLLLATPTKKRTIDIAELQSAATLIPLLSDNPDGYQDKLLGVVQDAIDSGVNINNIGVNVAPTLALLNKSSESPEKKTKIADDEVALVNEVNAWIAKAKAATPVPIDSICKTTTLIATLDIIALKKFRDVFCNDV